MKTIIQKIRYKLIELLAGEEQVMLNLDFDRSGLKVNKKTKDGLFKVRFS